MWTKTVVFLLLLIAVLLEVESSKKCPRIKKGLIRNINKYDKKCSGKSGVIVTINYCKLSER